jgi:transcription factor TGA
MASHRVGETGLSDSGPSNHHVPYSLFHGINAPSTSFMYVIQSSSLFHQNLNYLPNGFPSFSFIFILNLIGFVCLSAHAWHGSFNCFYLSNQEGSAFDFGELEEAIVLQGVKIRNDEAKARMLLSLSIISLFVT